MFAESLSLKMRIARRSSVSKVRTSKRKTISWKIH